MSESDGRSIGVPVVSTAIHVTRILKSFSVSTPALSLTQLSLQVGVKKSSMLRLLRTLASEGFLTFDSDSKHYRLGPALGRLGNMYNFTNPLRTLAKPFLVRVRDATNETTALHVRVGNQRICIEQAQSLNPVRVVVEVNRPYPLNIGSTGRVLRAFAATYLQEPDATALEKVRSNGYAIGEGELIPDAAAVCVPVMTLTDLLVGGLSIFAPAFRSSSDRMQSFIEHLTQAARELGELCPNDPLALETFIAGDLGMTYSGHKDSYIPG